MSPFSTPDRPRPLGLNACHERTLWRGKKTPRHPSWPSAPSPVFLFPRAPVFRCLRERYAYRQTCCPLPAVDVVGDAAGRLHVGSGLPVAGGGGGQPMACTAAPWRFDGGPERLVATVQ